MHRRAQTATFAQKIGRKVLKKTRTPTDIAPIPLYHESKPEINHSCRHPSAKGSFAIRYAACVGHFLCPRQSAFPFVREPLTSQLSNEVYVPFCQPSMKTACALDMPSGGSWAESRYSSTGNVAEMTSRVEYPSSPTRRSSVIGAPFETAHYHGIGILSTSSLPDYSKEKAYRYAVFQSNLTMVGATGVAAMASITTDASPMQKIAPRQASNEWWTENPENGGNQSNASPVGEPLVLLVFAIGLAVYRQKKARRTSAMENQSKQNQSHGKRISSPLTKSLSFILTPLFVWMPSPPPPPLPSPSSNKREAGEQKEHQSHKIHHSFSKSIQYTL